MILWHFEGSKWLRTKEKCLLWSIIRLIWTMFVLCSLLFWFEALRSSKQQKNHLKWPTTRVIWTNFCSQNNFPSIWRFSEASDCGKTPKMAYSQSILNNFYSVFNSLIDSRFVETIFKWPATREEKHFYSLHDFQSIYRL